MKEKAIAHWEKAVLALGVGLMAYFIYGAISLEAYGKTPEDFTKATEAARNNVTRSEPDVEKLTAPDMAVLASSLKQPVSADGYAFTSRWVRPFDFGQTFRDQPEILKPSKPRVQSNRGLLALFEVDEKGERVTRKVPKNKSSFMVGAGQAGRPIAAAKARQGRGRGRGAMGMDPAMMGGAMGGMPGMDPAMMGMDPAMMGGAMGGMPGMDPAMMGAGGMGMGMDPAMMDPAMMEMFAGNQGAMGMGMGMGMQPINLEEMQKQKTPTVRQRVQRFVIPRDALANKSKDKKEKDKGKDKKEEEMVDEYVEAMVGKHWVEIVASFPHSEQIKEYVRKLREPAAMVGLRYALAEVERRELGSDMEWSKWEPIDLGKMMDVVGNALDFEPEPIPEVMIKGLAMNIPFVQTANKHYLTLEEFEEPKLAQYTPEELNPMLAQKKAKRPPRPRRNLPGAPIATKAAPAKAAPTPAPQNILGQRGPANVALDRKGLEKGAVKENVKFENRFQIKDAMIRFWDFTVEPGRRYQYRVRVKAFNPNYQRPEVAQAEFATKELLVGPWSDASDDVYVEKDVAWYAGKQSTASKDKVTIESHFWSKDMGEWVTNEFQHRPGDIIGLSNNVKPNEVVKWDDKEKVWKMESVPLKTEFNAETVLLDVSGGAIQEDYGNNNKQRFKLPREIIAVNAYGDLVRRDSDADANDEIRSSIAEQYQTLIREFKPSAAKDEEEAAAGEEKKTKDPVTKDPIGK